MNYHKLAPLFWVVLPWVALTGTLLPWVVLPRAPLSWVAVVELMWTKKFGKKTTCNNIFSKQTAKNLIRHE